MNNDKYRSVFKRIETDSELRNRVLKAIAWHPWSIMDAKGEALDDAAWSMARVQRRIVEDVAR